MTGHFHTHWLRRNSVNFPWRRPLLRWAENYFWSFHIINPNPVNIFAEVIFMAGQPYTTPLPPLNATLGLDDLLAISAGVFPNDPAPPNPDPDPVIAGVNPEFSLTDLDIAGSAKVGTTSVTVVNGVAKLNSLGIRLVDPSSAPNFITLRAYSNGNADFDTTITTPLASGGGNWASKSSWQGKWVEPWPTAWIAPTQPTIGEFPPGV